MSTASCYTNKIRVVSEAKNKKVQYPGNIARIPQPIVATLPCNPDYSILNYQVTPKCNKIRPKCLTTATIVL